MRNRSVFARLIICFEGEGQGGRGEGRGGSGEGKGGLVGIDNTTLIIK